MLIVCGGRICIAQTRTYSSLVCDISKRHNEVGLRPGFPALSRSWWTSLCIDRPIPAMKFSYNTIVIRTGI